MIRPALRSLLVAAPLAVAAACAATAPAPVIDAARGPVLAPPAAQAAPAMPIGDPVALLARVGAADSLTTRQAASLLGPPDIDRRDGVGALLTWRLETCALALGFANDRLASVEPAARVAGAPSPGLGRCVEEAQARRAGQ